MRLNLFREARNLRRLIDKLFNTRDERNCVKQAGVMLERGFIQPDRLDEEKARISKCLEGLKLHASNFSAGRSGHIFKRVFEFNFATLAGVKPSNQEHGPGD